MSKKSGFTLVELLVVISIIAVLSVIGIVVFTNVQKSARDATRKSDIDAIAKAYELKYVNTGRYTAVDTVDFSSGGIPQDPSKGEYFRFLASDGSGFKVCAALDANPNKTCNTPGANCICKFSSQGTITSTASDPSTISTSFGSGPGGSAASTCDPNGTLSSGLVGYWNMDEAAWNGTSGEVKDSSPTLANGRSYNGTNTTLGKFNKAGSFNGSNNYLEISNRYPFATDQSFTVVAWVKSNKKTPGGSLFSVVDKGFGFTNTYGLLYRTTSDNKANAFFGVQGSSGSEQAWIINSVDISDDNWHLIAGVRDVSTDMIYVYTDNSSSVGIKGDPTVGALNNSSNIRMGARGGGLAQYFSGLIDDVRIYNRALSSDEIKTLYNNGQGCT